MYDPKAIQEEINASGVASLVIDGIWGPLTDAGWRARLKAAAKDPRTYFRSIAPEVMRHLVEDLKITQVQAAGILGNLGHESRGFTALHEFGQPEGRGGYGWAQWTGPRREDFFEWCKREGIPWPVHAASYGFLIHELNGSEKRSLSQLRGCKTLSAAVISFETHFERAGVKAHTGRIRWGQIALESVTS